VGEDIQPREREPVRPPDPAVQGDVHAHARARQSLVCPYCKDLLGATGFMACPNPQCGARYHLGCWQECVSTTGRCAIYGCTGGRSGEARPVAVAPVTRGFLGGPMLALTILAAIILGLGGFALAGHNLESRPPVAVAQPAPTAARPWLDIAYQKFNAFDHKGAIAAANEALGLAKTPGEKAESLSIRGLGFAWEKDFERAFPDLDAAIELAPRSAGYVRNRAVANELKGDHAACVRDCKKVLELDPKYPEAALIRTKIAEHEAALGTPSGG
jgi:hypothetical protein